MGDLLRKQSGILFCQENESGTAATDHHPDFFFAILHGQEYAFMSWMDHTNFQDAVVIFANNQKQMNF